MSGIDSCVLQFELDDCKISGGSGAFSDRLAGASRRAEYEREAVEVDGRAATLVRFRAPEVEGGLYVTALHIPIIDKGGWYISIDLRASCETRESRDRMRDVLLSVDADESW